MVKNHAYHTFESKYLLDYMALKIVIDSALLFITPNGKERKTNINDVKPWGATEFIKNAWEAFLISIQTKCKKINYDLRPHF